MIPQPAGSAAERGGKATSFSMENWRHTVFVACAIGVMSLLAHWLLPWDGSAFLGGLMIIRTVCFVLYGTWAAMWLVERYQTGEDNIDRKELGPMGRSAMRASTFVFWSLVMAYLVVGNAGVDALTTPMRIIVFVAAGLAGLWRISLIFIANIRALNRQRDERLDALTTEIMGRHGGSANAV